MKEFISQISSKNIFILSIGAFMISILISPTNCGLNDELIPDCTKLMMRLAKKQIKLFGECTKEIRETVKDNDELSLKIQCVVKCVLDKTGLLNEDKKVTNETMQFFMDKNVPQIFHSVSHDLLEHCVTEFSPKMDHEEELCTVYGDYVKCIQDVVGNVC